MKNKFGSDEENTCSSKLNHVVNDFASSAFLSDLIPPASETVITGNIDIGFFFLNFTEKCAHAHIYIHTFRSHINDQLKQPILLTTRKIKCLQKRHSST